MTWARQVGHVAAKDVRRLRWQLLVYALLLAAAAASFVTGRAFGPYSPTANSEVMGMPSGFVQWIPMASAFIGLLLAASVLQLDPPTRADAFWAARPLSPSAVLAAKVAMAVVVALLPAIGAVVALRSLDTSAAAARGFLAHAGLAYGEWLLAAMLLAALTDDLRAFVAALLAVLAALAILADTQVVDISINIPDSPAWPIAATIVSFVAGLALLARVYRTHSRGRIHWLAATAITVCLVYFSFVALAPMSLPGTLPTVSGPTMSIEPVGVDRWPTDMSIQLSAEFHGAADSLRYSFKADRFSIGGRRGSSRVSHGGVQLNVANVAVPNVGVPIRWLIDGQAAVSPELLAVRPMMATVSAETGDSAVLAEGVNHVQVDGTVIVSRSHIVANLPLRVGAAVTRDGRRVAIYSTRHDAGGAHVYVHISAVPHSTQFDLDLGGNALARLQFALVNDARGEGMLLQSQSTSGGSGWIVTPWIDVDTEFVDFTARSAPVQLDDAWYRGARLVVVEWNTIGSYDTGAGWAGK